MIGSASSTEGSRPVHWCLCTPTGGVVSCNILATSDFVRRDPDGTVLVDTRISGASSIVGTAPWGAPLTPHTFENVGRQEFRTLTVEMKDGAFDQPE